MILKRRIIKKLRNRFIAFFVISLVAIVIYFYLIFTSEINSLKISHNLIKDTIAENISTAIAGNIMQLNFLFIIQLIIFIIIIISLLITLWHLFNLYMVQMRNALLDPLTKIYNRRAALYSLRKEIKKSQKYKHSTTIAMLDIDWFKKYNDSNGHVAGDQLLQKFGKLLRSELREYDILGRYGGEEFIIIFPETKIKDVQRIVERIRKKVETSKFKGRANMPNKRVTVSIGMAEYNGKGGMTNNKLINEADKRLYQAKESGRNRVVWNHN